MNGTLAQLVDNSEGWGGARKFALFESAGKSKPRKSNSSPAANGPMKGIVYDQSST